MSRTCSVCGNSFNSKRNRTKCGRRRCNPTSGGVRVTCGGCLTEVCIPPSEVARFKYCSHSCSFKDRKPGQYRTSWSANSGSFTSDRVSGCGNPRWVDSVERVCRYCSSIFYVKPWEITDNHACIYCSRPCFISFKKEFESRENAPDWKGGFPGYRGSDWSNIRRIVIDEQNGHCWICAVFVGKSLQVHHIIPYRTFSSPEEANVRSNLIGCCESCHHTVEGMSLDRIISFRDYLQKGCYVPE